MLPLGICRSGSDFSLSPRMLRGFIVPGVRLAEEDEDAALIRDFVEQSERGLIGG